MNFHGLLHVALTAKAEAEEHVADQRDANETDHADRQLLHPGQNIGVPARGGARHFKELSTGSIPCSSQAAKQPSRHMHCPKILTQLNRGRRAHLR